MKIRIVFGYICRSMVIMKDGLHDHESISSNYLQIITIFQCNNSGNQSLKQAVPLFLSEIAPTRIRGGLNILFQLNVTIGILFANLVNYGTAK